MELTDYNSNFVREQENYKYNNLSTAIKQKRKSCKLYDAEFLNANLLPPTYSVYLADARKKIIMDKIADIIITSPPYWKKRDYKLKKQIGQEKSVEDYIEVITNVMDNWKGLLKDSGSVFLNVGDSYLKGRRMQIPSRIAIEAEKCGWVLRDQIIWVKPNSTPHSANQRLPIREEFILHFTKNNKYFYDIHGFKKRFDTVTNVWTIKPAYHQGEHLAPFPDELVERILLLSGPKYVCAECGKPFVRKLKKTVELDESRPQAERAMAKLKESDLTVEHIKAVQAVGISDAGKAIKFQSGAGKNSSEVRRLALEAKDILGGYFREFTFAKKKTVGWEGCTCGAKIQPGLIYDPFIGSGTSLRVANKLRFSIIGSDIKFYNSLKQTLAKTEF